MTNKTKYEEWLGLRNFPWEYTDTDRRGFDLVLDSNDDKVNDHGSCWKEDAVLTAAAPDMLQLLVDIAQGAQLGVVDERIERVLRAAMPGDVVDEILKVPKQNGRRGVDYKCEECERLDGFFLENGFHRCNNCGYPSK